MMQRQRKLKGAACPPSRVNATTQEPKPELKKTKNAESAQNSTLQTQNVSLEANFCKVSSVVGSVEEDDGGAYVASTYYNAKHFVRQEEISLKVSWVCLT